MPPSSARPGALTLLFEALELAGADMSGYDGAADWGRRRGARVNRAFDVRVAVGRLRRDYDEALERAERAERASEVLRAALRRIADAESGGWGVIAHEALREAENA